ncbi:MAG: ATP-binding protein [Salinibacterium sp.]|nr:ATP-binding protein [Salinibacterium sp.]
MSVAAPPDLLNRAELAVHEACMNVVDHAEVSRGSTIELSVRIDADALVASTIDHGIEFDPGASARPARGVIQERGYGVKIVRSIVDGMAYERVGDTNQLVLRIDLATSQRTKGESANE